MSIPTDHFGPDDLGRLEARAASANKRGDRCGWWLICGLMAHLRDVMRDRQPWLRDDALGVSLRRDCPGIYELRSGRRVAVFEGHERAASGASL